MGETGCVSEPGYVPTGDWPDRLYAQKERCLLYPYVKPGQNLAAEERRLNLGAHKGRLDYMENVIPGGRENTYVLRPEVHVGNWWNRMCIEKPGFMTSLGRRLPDNLTKCSEYREEISEYANFFKDYPDQEIRPPQSRTATKCVPFSVLSRHRTSATPFDNYMSVYSRDFTRPPPFIPPYMSGIGDQKRKEWIAQSLAKEVHYCTCYQQVYDPSVYDKQTEPLRRTKMSPYYKIEEDQEAERRRKRADDLERQQIMRDTCLQENFPANMRCGPGCSKDCHYHCGINNAGELAASAEKFSQQDKTPLFPTLAPIE